MNPSLLLYFRDVPWFIQRLCEWVESFVIHPSRIFVSELNLLVSELTHFAIHCFWDVSLDSFWFLRMSWLTCCLALVIHAIRCCFFTLVFLARILIQCDFFFFLWFNWVIHVCWFICFPFWVIHLCLLTCIWRSLFCLLWRDFWWILFWLWFMSAICLWLRITTLWFIVTLRGFKCFLIL